MFNCTRCDERYTFGNPPFIDHEGETQCKTCIQSNSMDDNDDKSKLQVNKMLL